MFWMFDITCKNQISIFDQIIEIEGEVTMESKRRSMVKALTWRLWAIIVLAGISYLMTYNITESVSITVLFNVIQIFLYFVHERIWNRVKWGKAQ